MVIRMDENGFRMFFGILKMMENEEVGKGSVENIIIKIIDKSEKDLTDTQKSRLYKDFVSYEHKRQQRRYAAKHSAQIEEAKYNEFLKDFFRGIG